MAVNHLSRLTKLCLCTAFISALVISLMSTLRDHWLATTRDRESMVSAEIGYACETCGDTTLLELYETRQILQENLHDILNKFEDILSSKNDSKVRSEHMSVLLNRLASIRNISLQTKERKENAQSTRILSSCNQSSSGDQVSRHKVEGGEKRPLRNNAIIVAYKRSGSSFVGQLFNQHPKVFYLYEPFFSLLEVEKSSTSRKLLRALSDHLLDVILHCKFREHSHFVGYTSTHSFRMNSEALSSPDQCTSRSKNHTQFLDSCSSLTPESLEDLCLTKDHSVIKTIRLDDLSILEPYVRFSIEQPTSFLKVLHLVRDPRAILASRSLSTEVEISKNWTLKDFRSSARKLCSSMLSMLRYATQQGHWDDHYHVIRYEDIAREPMKATDELHDFIGLEQSSEVYDWLEENTIARNATDYFSTKKNATAAISAWRLRSSFAEVRIVQSECTELMLLLGYRMAANEMELRNIEYSLLVPRLPGQSLFITNCLKQLISEFDYMKFENEIYRSMEAMTN